MSKPPPAPVPWSRAVLGGIGCLVAWAWLSDYLLCPLAFLTGHPCPGCGLTRSVLATLSGKWVIGFTYHPLGPPFVLGLSILLALAIVGRLHRPLWDRIRKFHGGTTRVIAFCGLLTCALLYGVWVIRFLGAFGGPAAVHSPLNG